MKEGEVWMQKPILTKISATKTPLLTSAGMSCAKAEIRSEAGVKSKKRFKGALIRCFRRELCSLRVVECLLASEIMSRRLERIRRVMICVQKYLRSLPDMLVD